MFASKTLDDCKPLQLRIQPPYTGVADQPQAGRCQRQACFCQRETHVFL